MAFFEIKNIYKNFGNVEVLKGIDVTLEKGQVLSIIGSSGSGKTTLLRCINFLETPDVGEMYLDGECLLSADGKKRNIEKDKILRDKRLNFGLVFQSFNLFPQYNVLKNVTLAPSLLLKEKVSEYERQLKLEKTFTRKQIKENVKYYKNTAKTEIGVLGMQLVDKVGLSEKVTAYPCELSGGQQQRVAIARALALNPKVLCFDEPTSALDPELTGEVLKVIRALKEDGWTMIIVTHEMSFAKNVSDKVVFMADGVVEEVGTPTEVFDNPKSEKLQQFLSNIEKRDEI